MAKLASTKTHENLKHAFAGESQANRRYLYFARRADIEGYPGRRRALPRHVGSRDRARVRAPGLPEGSRRPGDGLRRSADTEQNLKSAVEGETYEYTQMYPGFAKTAREEGFAEIAEWFETLARAEKSHAGRFQKGLDTPRQRSSERERGPGRRD